MIFTPTAIEGVWLVDLQRREDARGGFARSFCAREFAAHGLPASFVQCNISTNARRGTLRGLHWQDLPDPEGKLVRCVRGAIFDVAVDLRPGSPTRLHCVTVELSAGSGRALYVPPGCAHGFQTLVDDSEVFYQMTAFYDEALARGARWDDPALAIDWPIAEPILSPRDLSHPQLA